MPKKKSQQIIKVNDSEIRYSTINGNDYLSLTDMAKQFGGDRAIHSWLRTKNTIEFLGLWEVLNNPNFKVHEFVGFKNQAGSNKFNPSPKHWVETTGAKGLQVKPGRYGGGTTAHRDIAFEFGTWLSPEFKMLLITEYQKLKAQSANLIQWDYRRFLTKVNYRLHANSVKTVLIPRYNTPKQKQGLVYADEADLLNVAVFGMTARDWREQNPKAPANENMRDSATIEQLTVLANLENLNSMLIHDNIEKMARFEKLRREAIRQLQLLLNINSRLESPELADKPLKIDNPKGFDDTMKKIAGS